MMRFTVLLFALCFWGLAQGQKAVSQQVNNVRAEGARFIETPLLKFQSNDVLNRSYKLEGLSRGTVISIDQDAIETLLNAKSDHIVLPLPVSDRSDLKLTLIRNEIFAEDFALYASSDPSTPVDYRPGVHYKGIVEGDPNSLVAISVYSDQIMGFVSTDKGNMVLGRINGDRENHHVLFYDKDLDRMPEGECETADDGIPYTEEELNFVPDSRDAGDCVRVYIEIDDDIVTQKGGATPATNYITGLFNQSFVLYANDGMQLIISEIKAWTTNSPYSGSTSSAMLNSFTANSGAFNGNIGHLVSYQASGGIAYVNTLCNSNPDYRKCFSSIDASYSNVPTFSWSVMVVTHEMGHVIGSKHTHACAWNGNNTAIDGCTSVEGSCPNPGLPSGGGTIMSYCHLTNVGINLNLGFGPQPKALLQGKINAAGNCLTTCGPPPPPPPPAYCESNGSNSSYEYINKVVIGSINNTSGNNGGYGNYTALSTNLTKGTAYTINLTPGFSGSAYIEYWRVWIDYNGDLDWSDAGEQVAQGTGSTAINLSFTVPASNATLNTRMRVSMQYGAYPPNCGSFTYGEVEDYSVSIVASSSASCTDGIQNQGETGVDCGGPCAPCPPPATCNDGIQNQGETGVDCGGPCAPCPPPATCNDGIQNQGETGVDCGGPCPACPPPATCNDGIQNQGETGVDCGGPCAPCPPPPPTCNDGIQNQGETGVDCGGPCAPCPPPPGGNEIHGAYFETGWDGWQDGGSDVTRVNHPNSYEGLYSIRLADNAGIQSTMTSPSFNVATGTIGLQFKFYFYAYSFETNEDFWLQYRSGATGTWNTIAVYKRGVNFNNNTFYTSTVTVPNFVPTANATFRIVCDASDNADQLYIDQITITKLTAGVLIEEMVEIREVDTPFRPASNYTDEPQAEKELFVYPNPVQDILNISFNGEITAVRVIGLTGQEMQTGSPNYNNTTVDISHLPQGVYFLWIQSEGEWYPTKFSKM